VFFPLSITASIVTCTLGCRFDVIFFYFFPAISS
jgi:hypothetical protein